MISEKYLQNSVGWIWQGRHALGRASSRRNWSPCSDCRGLSNSYITVRSDNMGVWEWSMHWRKSHGVKGTESKKYSLLLCRQYGIQLKPSWIPTEMNPTDLPSRGVLPPWLLVFKLAPKLRCRIYWNPGCPNTAWRWTLNTGCWIMISLSLSLDFLMISDAGHSVLQKLLKKQCRTSTLYWLCYCFGTTFGDCRLSSKVGDDRQANDGYLM